MRKVLLALSMTVAVGASSQSAFAQGVLVYKNQNFHEDSLAKALVYTSLDAQGRITWVQTGNKRIRFENHQFHTWVPFRSTLPDQLVTPEEIGAFVSERKKVRDFAERFPEAKPLLAANLQRYAEAENEIARGNVRHQGRWLSRSALESKLKQETEAAETERRMREQEETARRQAEAERLEQEKAAKLQQIELERQRREAAREEKLAALEKQRAELETSRRDLENERLRVFELLNSLLINE